MNSSLNHIIRCLILISAIIPASIVIIVGMWVVAGFIVDKQLDKYSLLVTLSTIFGILGYIGLWRNLINFNKFKRKNNLLLIMGICSILMIISVVGIESFLKMIIDSNEGSFITLLLIWPLIAALMIIIHNYMKDNSQT